MKNNVDKQYLKFLEHILNNGVMKKDRTGTGTISVFGYTMRFNMKSGFPLLTSKKIFTKAVIHELIWFLRGDTNIKYLLDNDVHIWDGDCFKNYQKRFETENKFLSPVGDKLTKEKFINEIKTNNIFAKEFGEMGPIYGKQWRKWKPESEYSDGVSYCLHSGIDQIKNLVDGLKTNPDSRRLMVNAWNVGELDQMTLPPCHYGFQCYTTELTHDERIKLWCDSIDKDLLFGDDITSIKLDEFNVQKRKLDLIWTQRSCDVPLGIPFNIASYALLLHLLAKEVNMVPNELIFSGGDCHIYTNQIKGVNEQLKRETFKLPKLKLHNKSIFDLKYEDFEIQDYTSSPIIQFPLSN